MPTLLVIVLLSLCWLPCGASAEIYKWRDEKNQVHYSDMPPPVSVRAPEKLGKGTQAFPLTRSDAPKLDSKDSPAIQAIPNNVQPHHQNLNQGKPPPANNTAANDSDTERLKAQNCAAARTNYRNYALGGRMQTVNAQGERDYLTDAQIQEALAQAQRDIDDNCTD